MTDFKKLKQTMIEALKGDKTAHNDKHTLRVLEFAKEIAKSENDVDMEILKASVLLHDIAYQAGFFKGEHGDISAKLAEPILKSADFPESKIHKVLQAIELHNWFFHFEKNVPKEVKILRDADRLDALGNHAIERAELFYGKDELLKGLQRNIDATENNFETSKGKELSRVMVKKLKMRLTEIAKH